MKQTLYPLRRVMASTITVTVLLVWLVTMVLLTTSKKDQIYQQVSYLQRTHHTNMEELASNFMQSDLTPEERRVDVSYQLSFIAADTLMQQDGGVALALYDSQGELLGRSQLTSGRAHTQAGGRYYLELDSALDDAGQIAFARWLIAHRDSNIYALYPPNAGSSLAGDGTTARITAVEAPGQLLRVYQLALVHPDGSVESVVDAPPPQGEALITLECPFLELGSGLLPSLGWDDNRDTAINGHTNLARRLAHYHSAEGQLEQLLDTDDAPNAVSVSGDGTRVVRSVRGSYGDTWGTMVTLGTNQIRCLSGWSYSGVRAAMWSLRWVWISTLAVALLLIWGLSRRLARRVARPLEGLCREVEEADYPCGLNGSVSELNALAQALNATQGKLSDSLQKERDFTRAVTHELRTPLALLRSYAEGLSEDIAPDKRQEYLAVIMDEADRMDTLVASLLDLSRLQAGAAPLNPQPVDFTALVSALFHTLEKPAAERGVALSLALDPCTVSGDAVRLRQVAANFASNALRHSRSGGSIRVSLTTDGVQARLVVENDGEPIPAEALPRLWAPFYRGDSARTRDAGGAGLGLAIVHQAVTLHGGSCGAANLSGGVQFWCALPCLQSESSHGIMVVS